MEKMNYGDFVKTVAKSTGFTIKDIKEVLKAVENAAINLVHDGTEVRFTPSISIYTTERAARTGRNPKTGEAVQIPASKSLKAKFSASIKGAVQ